MDDGRSRINETKPPHSPRSTIVNEVGGEDARERMIDFWKRKTRTKLMLFPPYKISQEISFVNGTIILKRREC